MEAKVMQQLYRNYLTTLPLMTLRILGRNIGAAHASSSNKEILVDCISAILAGTEEPAPRSNRGAPAKQSYLDPAITEQLERIRRDAEWQESLVRSDEEDEPLQYRSDEPNEDNYLQVSSGEEQPSIFQQPLHTGILEIMQGGYGFLRTKNCQPSANGDVFIAAPIIHAMQLREGDYLVCTAKPRIKNESPAVGEVLSINGIMPAQCASRPNFDNLTAQYANEKIRLSGGGALSLRLLDLFAPIGKGQRALIIAPPKAGKTTLLKDVAHAVECYHSEIHLIVLLIDERPEEVTDIRNNLHEAEVIYSTFDEGAERHIRAAELTIAHAKRLAELGKDVVILLDSLTKLTRAYNYVAENSGKTLSGGLDVSAFAEPKRFFGAARNTVEAGSITILATALVETGSRMDEVIYEEFKGTGNSDIFLSRELAERRIFPAIDIRRSGTRKEELLLSEEETAAVYTMREKGLTENMAGLLEMMRSTSDNAEFVARLPEWLKVYKLN